MTHANLQQRQAGVGLIEVMVASVFVTLSLVALVQVLGVALTGSAESRVRLHALNAAQEKIEELRGMSRHDQYPPLAAPTCDTLPDANTSLNRCWTVSACPSSMSCRQLQVEVKWQGVLGAEQAVKLTSYIAEADPVRGGMALAR